MRRITSAVALAVIAASARPVDASDWIPTLEQGLKQAAVTGQAVLYVTKWKPGV